MKYSNFCSFPYLHLGEGEKGLPLPTSDYLKLERPVINQGQVRQSSEVTKPLPIVTV